MKSVPDKLADYLRSRESQRNEEINEKWDALSPREQRLVREASIMGFVQGHRASGGRFENDKFPRDTEILHSVLGSVNLFPDIYPFLAALPKRKRLPRKR